MKTVQKWFEELPEPQKSQAINNTTGNVLKSGAESLSDALLTSFPWNHTKEGFDYWNKLYKSLNNQ